MDGEFGSAPNVRTAATWNWSPLVLAMRASASGAIGPRERRGARRVVRH
jgi:hypothetical protein